MVSLIVYVLLFYQFTTLYLNLAVMFLENRKKALHPVKRSKAFFVRDVLTFR